MKKLARKLARSICEIVPLPNFGTRRRAICDAIIRWCDEYAYTGEWPKPRGYYIRKVRVKTS